MIALKIKRLRPAAISPRYATEHASGMDLSACLDAPVTIESGKIALVPTGWAIAIPPGTEGQVRPRSGLALKYGISIPNSPGTIDADYRGEVGVILINLGAESFVINHGDRIAQLVLAPVLRAEVTEADSLEETERGPGGFGSTGLGK